MLGVTWFLPLQNAVISNTPLGISTTDPVIIPVPLFSSPVGICWNLQVLPGHALSSVGIYAMSGAGAIQVADATALANPASHTHRLLSGASEYLLSAQSSQTVWPEEDVNLPAVHAEHASARTINPFPMLCTWLAQW